MNERMLVTVAHARRQLLVAWTVAGTLVVAVVLAAIVWLGAGWLRHRQETNVVQQIAPRVSDTVRPSSQPPAAAPDPGANPGLRQPGEWIGTLTQPAELLDGPDSAAQRRAMLDANARVLVLATGPVWLRVRTEHGDGYVLKGLVRADRP